MSHKPTGRQIATALGLSPGRVSQLRKDGMPCDSVESAEAWYRRRVDPARSSAQRNALPRARSSASPLEQSHSDACARAAALALAAHYALAAGRFPDVEAELRAALRTVPLAERPSLALPMGVFKELTREVFDDMAAHEEPGDRVEGPMSDEEAEWMGSFWFAVAAGELVLRTDGRPHDGEPR